jgi:EmrB/QacA subfamily drug resistance transporter
LSETGLKRTALLIATLAAFLVPFDVSAVNIALPAIGKELAMDAISLNWVSTAYLLSSAVFLIPFGRIADIRGRKRIFSLGILIFICASFTLTLSNSPAMLIALRIVQGIGGSMMGATMVAIISSAFPQGERGRALGINSAAIYIGLTTGPFLGGLITAYIGWRSIFLVNVPLGILTLILISWKLKPEWCEAKGEKFDLAGAIIFGVSLASTIYGVSLLPGFFGWVFALGGGLGLVVFALFELRQTSPIVNIRLFRGNRVFMFSNLAALLNYGSTFGVAFLLSLYLQYIKGYDPSVAGTILLCQPILQVILSPFVGRLSDRIEPRLLSSAGMAVTSLALFFLTFIGSGTSPWIIVVNLAMLGIGLALFVSPNTNAIMGSVERKSLGVASGMLSTMRNLGQTLSMGAVILVFALYIGYLQITPAYYGALLAACKILFTLFSISCFAGIFVSMSRGKVRTKN